MFWSPHRLIHRDLLEILTWSSHDMISFWGSPQPNTAGQIYFSLPDPVCSATYPLFSLPQLHISLCPSTIQPYKFLLSFPSCPIPILISSLRTHCFHCAEPSDFLYHFYSNRFRCYLYTKVFSEIGIYPSALMLLSCSYFTIGHIGLHYNTLLFSLFSPLPYNYSEAKGNCHTHPVCGCTTHT